MDWIKRFLGSKDTPAAPDNAKAKDLAALTALEKEFDENREEMRNWEWFGPDLDKLTASAYFTTEDRARQAEWVKMVTLRFIQSQHEVATFRGLARGQLYIHDNPAWAQAWGTCRLQAALLQKLMSKRLPLSVTQLATLLESTSDLAYNPYEVILHPLAPIISALENHAKAAGDMDALRSGMEALRKALQPRVENDPPLRRQVERLDELLGNRPKLPIIPGEAWADAAIEDLNALGEKVRESWIALLWHCKSAAGAKPSGKWSKTAATLLKELDASQFAEFAARWMILADKKRNSRALTDLEWRVRCAANVLDANYSQLCLALPNSPRKWDIISNFRVSILKAADGWEWMRRFTEHPEVIKAYDGQVPNIWLDEDPPAYDPIEDSLIIAPHMDLLCGLAWTCGQVTDKGVTRALGLMAVSAFRKVPGKGPRAIRVGNACIYALGEIGSADALGQLALLKIKVKFGGAQAALSKALTQLAEKLGVTPEDLEEMSVPGYGMTEPGRLTQAMGDFTAELEVINSRQTALVWKRADGKPQKSLPAALKASHAEDIKELMAAKKDIEKMLPAQAERLDKLYLQGKQWPLSLWRERYLDHPLIGALARRLIWNFTFDEKTVPAVFIQGRLVDRSGQPLEMLEQPDTQVSLWHPLQQTPDAVLGWRGFLEEWEIVQPFKQAHREVYVLTPAEEQTRVYSNRFAAHLLRQHQFNALCAARGWKNKLRLMVDDEYPPATRQLPAFGLRAEYWIEGAGDNYGNDTTESGAYLYVTTDQVRFYQAGTNVLTAHAGGGGYGPGRGPAAEPLPLSEIDPLVLSEVMRDVDLFVGVASVGNDPNWLDGGRNEQQRGYWRDYGFGELNASAQTRRQVLERLVPKLKIAGQCSLEDRFLIVRGQRHSYKIHLGSGNILISPQDKYLCIVPAQAQLDQAGSKVFLPFEGDRTLSVILSKAMLLAADDKITDKTILAQLK
jgi:hypothetical protein